MELRIGCSGWMYAHWRGVFYSPGVPTARWLEHYCTRFDTVELNASFYRWPSERTVQGWPGRTPPGFRFAVKVTRRVTHLQRLRDCEGTLAAFIERVRPLGERLGPLLYQLPPSMQRDDARLAAFLELLPRDLLHAFEFRHRSWWADGVFELLRARGAAFCVYHLGGEQTPVVATSDEAYVRFHGPAGAY